MTDETTPTNEQNDDDAEAHAARSGRAPAQPAEVESHATRGRGRHNEELPTGKQSTERETPENDGPDVEAHATRAGR